MIGTRSIGGQAIPTIVANSSESSDLVGHTWAVTKRINVY